MHGRKTLNNHAALMNRMAQALGVNLTELMIRGRLSGGEWREAVVRCTGCSEPADCLHWLNARGDGAVAKPPARTAPGYCANREMMARLQEMVADGRLPAEAEGGK